MEGRLQDEEERGRLSLPNSQAVPLIHPDGKKLYCGGQWHALSVYDVDSLKHIDDVELGHSMAGIGMRFVRPTRTFQRRDPQAWTHESGLVGQDSMKRFPSS